MAFATERDLVDTACAGATLQRLIGIEPGASWVRRTEVKGLFGIPDVVVTRIWPCACDGESVVTAAFEMKLSHWRRALAQAFRYRSFAELSYVVIDAARVGPALKNMERFRRSNVGLASLDEAGIITIHHRPAIDAPFSHYLR